MDSFIKFMFCFCLFCCALSMAFLTVTIILKCFGGV